MEPVTHFLTGACIGRAGFNRKTAYATLAAVLAAEAADLDVVWGFAGPVEGLKHHRGITHTFWAVPVVAGVVVGAVWLLDRWLKARRRKVEKNDQPASSQPIHWGWLYLTACVAALSHLLLDWTNNYGVRPFFPFNPHWYAGSFMFIAEPVVWALLFLALFMPWVLGLADREIGARKTAVSRPWLGDLCAHRNAGAGLLALGRARPGAGDGQQHANLRRAGPAHGGRAVSGESLPLARDRRNAESLPDRGDQHAHRLHRQRSPQRCDCTSQPTPLPSRPPSERRWDASISIGERGPWCAKWDRNHSGPAPGHGTSESSARPRVDHGRI